MPPEFGPTLPLQPHLSPFKGSLCLIPPMFHVLLSSEPLLILWSCSSMPSIPFPYLTFKVLLIWGSVLLPPCHCQPTLCSLPSLGFHNECSLHKYNDMLLCSAVFLLYNSLRKSFNVSVPHIFYSHAHKGELIKIISEDTSLSNILRLPKISNYWSKGTLPYVSFLIDLI